MQTGMGASERVRVLGAAAALVLFSALSACGGGGGGHDNPPLEMSVSVDGVADADTLTPGESTTISVPSGATLVFSSEGQTRWAPVATDSSFHVNSFSFTSKSLTVTSNGGGSLVVVFKDKADESKTATLTVNVAPKEFQHVDRVDGEVEAWTQTWTDINGGTSQSEIRQRTVLMENGAYGIHFSDGPDTYSSTRSLYDAQDRYLGYVFTVTGVECRYDNPLVYVSYPLQVGKSWSGTATRVCSDMTVSQEYTRSVEGFERVVVPQGTHDALRIRAELHRTQSIPGWTDHTTSISTCWWAVDLGRNVKCDHVFTYDDGSSDRRTDVLTSLTR